MESHKSFIKELYTLKESGKRIFVITAGHDYNDSAYILQGDGPHTEGAPVYNFISGILKRFSFIIKKIEPKLSKNGNKLDLKKMLLDTIGNNKGFSDADAEFKLK